MEVISRVDIVPHLMQVKAIALARVASKGYCKTVLHIGPDTNMYISEAVMSFKCRKILSCLNIPHR